jgi:superfamily II DNA or RNA helicase
MQKLPHSQNAFIPRKGQQDLIEYLPQIKPNDTLTVQWPTGYGKSIGFALTWKHCHQSGIANRFLIVVANDTQRRQIVTDFAGDCRLVNAPCEGGIWEFQRSGGDIKAARNKSAEVFVCTVQQLDASNRGGVNTLKDLLTQPGTCWMIGFDEFHHYGEDMPWGDAAKVASELCSFTLAMSATPYRRGGDHIFPEPKLVVTYQQAVNERAIKSIVCHSYEYAVAVIEEGQEVANYTTTELQCMANGDLDRWEERRGIRYSPQYLHPLIKEPLTRLRLARATYGKRLQLLIRAMSCRHAKMVCEQVKVFADGLTVDWIGTNGRTDDENRKALDAFCPPKARDGKRGEPTLDVLVQVSMAGEGFDSVNVVEIVDLFPVSTKALTGRATQDKQFYGRGARMIKGAEGLDLRVSVPSDHPLHAWAGKSLNSWMDCCDEKIDPGEEPPVDRPATEADLFDFPELMRERDIELITIITDAEHFESFKQAAIDDLGFEPPQEKLENWYLKIGNKVAQNESKQTRVFQLREYLDGIVGRLALVKAKTTNEVSGAIIGRYKKEVNSAIKRQFGKSREEMDTQEMEDAAKWLRSYLQNMKGLNL